MVRPFDRALGLAALACAALLVLDHAAPLGAQAPAPPTGREIVARHLKAMGGEAAFRAVQSMHARGTVTLTAQQLGGTVEIFSARPNRQLLRATLTGVGETAAGFDGKVGWMVDPMTGATLLTGRQLSEMADEAVFDAPLYLPSHVKDLTVVGREEFDGRQAYRLKVTFASGNEQFELFDVETGHQIGSEARRETVLGIVPTTTALREFKAFGALTLPTVFSVKQLGFEQVVTITAYEFNDVPPETFDLPPRIKALIKAPAPAGR